MPLGPILTRELTRLARNRRSYGKRTVIPLGMVLIIGLNDWAWRRYNGGPSTVQDVSRFGRYLFGQFALIQVAMTAYLVPDLVARTIAEESDRRTLGFLLATPLPSASIVAGKLAAALWHYLGCLVAGLPVVMMLPLLGGVKPELVLLSYAGTVSMALFLAGLAIVFSIAARRARDAVLLTHALAAYWIGGTVVVLVALPGLAPWLYYWLRPINELVLASSPSGLVVTATGIRPAGAFLNAFGRMIALQLAGFVLLVSASIVGLRPAYRRQQDGLPALERRPSPRSKRPPCSDRPLVWKERHVGRPRGWLRLLAALVRAAVVLGTLLALYRAGAGSALMEAAAWGYRATDAPSKYRLQYNGALRLITLVVSFLYSLVIAGHAAEGIAVERARGTWPGLLATPLEARQLIRGKMLGACWRSRDLGLLLVGLGLTGLLTGAVHPIGFAAALVGLLAATWFRAALGTYASLACRDLSGAANAAIMPVVLLDLTGALALSVPEPVRCVLLGALSFPLVECVSLVSYRDVGTGLRSARFPRSGDFPVAAGEPGWHVVLTWVAGVLVMALSALVIERRAIRRFDRLTGRPVPQAGAQA